MKRYVIQCEFPDEDQKVYVTIDSIMGKKVRIFSSFDEAKAYASKNFHILVYNIDEIEE